MSLHSFNSEYSAYGGDYLYIYDGVNSSAVLLAALTGSYSSALIYTTSRSYMFVKFMSNGYYSYSGFNATYTINSVPGFCSSSELFHYLACSTLMLDSTIFAQSKSGRCINAPHRYLGDVNFRC